MTFLRSHSSVSRSGSSITSRSPSTTGTPRAFSMVRVSRTSPRKPNGSLSTSIRSGAKTSAVWRIRDARMAMISSMPISRLSEV